MITSKDHDSSLGYYLQQRGKNTQQTINILVVDDEHDINLTLEYILNYNGFNVYSFTNPLSAEIIVPRSWPEKRVIPFLHSDISKHSEERKKHVQ